jgi:response regulator RpfG family c-di-GMP phosphodiesterase
MGSALHDIGKVGIEDDILNKPGKLTAEEFKQMQEHANLGYEVLKNSQRKPLQVAASIAYEHHEKWDGAGYPQGLKGEAISIYGRIVAIVDVLDALLSKRIYKEAWAPQKVKELLLDERGRHFDPKIVDIVVADFDDYVQIVQDLTE